MSSCMALRCSAVPAGLCVWRYCLSSGRGTRLARSERLSSAVALTGRCRHCTWSETCCALSSSPREAHPVAGRDVDLSPSDRADEPVHERDGGAVPAFKLCPWPLLSVEACYRRLICT